MWSKKWYLKRNISCDADLLNELLETDVPWDDAIVVWAGKLRKLWDSLSKLRSSLCVKDDWKGQFWGLRYCLSKLRSLLSFFTSGMTPNNKIAQFNWECIGCLWIMPTCRGQFAREIWPDIETLVFLHTGLGSYPVQFPFTTCTYTLNPYWKEYNSYLRNFTVAISTT